MINTEIGLVHIKNFQNLKVKNLLNFRFTYLNSFAPSSFMGKLLENFESKFCSLTAVEELEEALDDQSKETKEKERQYLSTLNSILQGLGVAQAAVTEHWP